MSGVKGLRQNSKMRKNAAVAVRLMARMRKSLARQRNKRKLEAKDSGKGADDADDDDDDDHVEDEGGDEVNVNDAQSFCGSNDKVANDAASSDGNESSDSANVQTERTASDDDNDDEQQLAAAKVQRDEEEHPTNKGTPERETNVASTSPGRKRSTRPTETSDDGISPSGDVGDNVKGPNIVEIKIDRSETSTAGVESSYKMESDGDGTPKRKNSANNANETPDDDTDSPGRRARRVRKQATYYDPQNGPASQWQSDGVNEWKRISRNVEEDDEVDEGSEDDESDHASAQAGTIEDESEDKKQEVGKPWSPSKKGSKKGGDKSPWCKFCMDDKNIPVCCFCACRVCFGKHEQVSCPPTRSHEVSAHSIVLIFCNVSIFAVQASAV